MESTLKNMVLSLLVITLTAAATVGMVYRLTAGKIAQARVARTNAALIEVLPAFDNDPSSEKQVFDMDGIPVTVHTARKGGEVVGYAVETATWRGFSGEINMLIGFLPDKTIRYIQVLQHAETPGFGDKIADPDNALAASFRGNNPGNLQMGLRKEGGDIDGITGSTITSRAYIEAVARGYNALVRMTGGQPITEPAGGGDAATEATAVSGATPAGRATDASSGATPANPSSYTVSGATLENTGKNTAGETAGTTGQNDSPDATSGATPEQETDASSGATADQGSTTTPGDPADADNKTTKGSGNE